MKLLMFIALLFIPLISFANDNEVFVMFWNLENFFDWRDTGKSVSDSDFSCSGKYKWTVSKFYKKCDMISKAVLWIGDKYGKMPDIIGLCEIENRGVLYKLLNDTLLRKFGYSIVHYDSYDKRGIDVALLYRKSEFLYISSSLKTPEYSGLKMSTRDILEVTLQYKYNKSIYHFIVNHHPSKFGGSEKSQSRRFAVMNTLRNMCDSLKMASDSSMIIAMGDFNDNPLGKQFDIIEPVLENKAKDLYDRGKGTIRFRGKWDLIDMFFVDQRYNFQSVMDIVTVPFLMVWDNTFPGFKPLRTYLGPKYIAGVSDHCPIVLKLNF